ncbi:MAG: hypothetical protein WBL80_08440 [Erysipelotrichaceae bacterium]
MDDSLFKKLNLKAGMTLCVIAPYDDFAHFLKAQKAFEIVTHDADFVLVFVRERAELIQRIDEAKQARKSGGKLWLAYPKATSTHKPDINRDSLFELTQGYGLIINGNFALDEQWSLLRTKDI